MLSQLDVHTALLEEEVYDDLMTRTQGEFGGLGIQITIRDDYPTVVTPLDDTPAFRLGIQGGDQIVEIEGESTKGWKSEDAVKKLRGPKGTQVNIGVRRVGTEKVMPFTITREIITIESVPHSFMLGDGIGYIKINDFAKTTAQELEKHLHELEAQGMHKLVLDLRFNPGGLLTSAKEVSELFLERGDLIVYTKGRLQQQNMSYYTTGNAGRAWKSRPLVVLVNSSSASASEILAGAIQDHDVGVVLGQNSFGKGSVQTVFELSDTEALKLTTARYYTPSGRSIHKERSRDGEPIEGEESQTPADEIVENQGDPELDKREVFYTDKGREVYGGGGIMPDYEIEPTLLNDFAVAVERDATFFTFANEWLSNHTAPKAEIVVTDEMYKTFVDLAMKRPHLPEYFEDAELEFERAAFDTNREYVEEGIEREIARRALGSTAAYRVSLERDGQLLEAIEILKKVQTQEELFKLTEQLRQKRLAELAVERETESKN
jgi:carboxyl-terminal processing protease